jgi:hypothetical protein
MTGPQTRRTAGDGEAEEHLPILGDAQISHTKLDTLKHLTLAKVVDEFV